MTAPLVRHPAKDKPATGDLPDAIRAWASGIYAQAKLAAAARMRTHPDLSSGPDLSDWRDHLSMRERDLIEAAMRFNVWRPE